MHDMKFRFRTLLFLIVFSIVILFFISCGNSPDIRYCRVCFVIDSSNSIELSVPEDSIVNPPTDPVLEGYLFSGWYKDSERLVGFDFTIPITTDVYIYAGWTENAPDKYIIRFETNGGSYVQSQVVESGGRVTVPEHPIKDGFLHAGWYLDKDLLQVYDFSKPVSANLVLYAKWIEYTPVIKCTVTFNANKPEGAISSVENLPNPITVISGGMAGITKEPSLEGYIFEGWYTADGKIFSLTEDIITEDMLLYAKWSEEPPLPKYTVTFKYKEAVLCVEEIEEGQNISSPSGKTGTAVLTDIGDSFSYTITDDATWTDAEGNSFDFSSGIYSDIDLFTDVVNIESFAVYSEKGLFAWAEEVNIKNDIDCILFSDIRLEKTWVPIAFYSGQFDGQGYEIANIEINECFLFKQEGAYNTDAFVGFWVYLEEGSKIINLNLDIQTDLRAPNKANGTGFVGGIAARVMKGADIVNCSVSLNATVERFDYVGGIAGVNDGKIYNCHSVIDNMILDVDSTNACAGGVAGRNGVDGQIVACSSTSNKIRIHNDFGESNFYSSSYLGGVLGYNEGTVIACYVNSSYLYVYMHGEISYVAGFVGYDDGESPIVACYSISDEISGLTTGLGSSYISRVRGFSGINTSANACYWKGSGEGKYSESSSSTGITEVLDDDWTDAMMEMNKALPIDFEWQYVKSNGDFPLILERR